MGAFTAHILIGQSHPYDGGLINIHHSLFLAENGVARWILQPFSPTDNHVTDARVRIGWIPTIDTMVEDGLLLLGLHAWKDEELIQLADSVFLKPWREVEVLNELVIHESDRLKLHQVNRKNMDRGKLVATVMSGSTIHSQLGVLEHYPVELEVCVPSYVRVANPWSGQVEAGGSLNS